jgi:hypothetical protein
MITHTPDIITRLNAAACMLNDYEQHNDCPEEVFGDRTAADACDDAAAIITELLSALKIALSDIEDFYQGSPTKDEFCGTEKAIRAAIAKATGEEA